MIHEDKISQVERELPLGLLNWYPWEPGASVCCVGASAEVFAADLQQRGLRVYAKRDAADVPTEKFDYIVAVSALERAADPVACLREWKSYLNHGGHLLLACENRLGLRYFCGDKDSFTHRNFDGIEDYRNFNERDREFFGGRNYARYEIEQFLDAAGFGERCGYSVLPGLEMPQQIYAWDYLPKEKLAIRYTPLYHDPKTVFLNEEQLYDSVIANGMFHQMANAYLIDCALSGEAYHICHVTTSMDRGHRNATATVIRRDGVVEKVALYAEGNPRIEALLWNTKELADRGIDVVGLKPATRGCWNGEPLMGVEMDYIESPTALEYLRSLVYEDVERFKGETIRFLETILRASDVSDNQPNEELGTFYRHGFTDMMPLNCFYHEGKFVFFDQEFCEPDYPVNVILVRALDILYMNDKTMESVVPMTFFLEYFGLKEKQNLFRDMGSKYICALREREQLQDFNLKYLADGTLINSNRQRMNYSADQYQHIFVDMLADTQGRDVYVFGAGLWARKFVAEYGDQCTIKGLLDNNPANWGNKVDGITVMNPEVLRELDAQQYKVIVCVKYYASILVQLRRLGNQYFGLYDPYIDRTVCNQPVAGMMDAVCESTRVEEEHSEETVGQTAKKYHIGYIAGVFDLFHVGHLNLLRRAKEQCEYLIVGVVSDEQASAGKARSPYICETDRLEIVQSCRYVDKAYILPMAASGTRDAYKKYHFDVQFSGSDYEHDPYWLKEQQWLRERGSDLVFFPYTQSTSSTKIKEALTNQGR